jgi:hypothetical protein
MACAGCSGFEPGTLQIFDSVVRNSLPSGLWASENIGKHFLSLPTWFYSQAWSLSGLNVVSLKPIPRLLHEIITRRTLAAGYTHTEIPCLTQCDNNTTDNLVYEEVPLNGWWSKGVSSQHKHTSEKKEKTNEEIKAGKQDKITVKIKLPESESLFTVSGAEFISSKEVEKGSAEAKVILQSLFLEALHAIQKCGEGYLESACVDLKTFSGLKEEHSSPSPSPSPSPVELGEDSPDDSSEIASKMKIDVHFVSFGIRAVRVDQSEMEGQKEEQHDIRNKMDIHSDRKYASEILESSSRSAMSKCVRNEECFEEGSNLKKTRIESIGVNETVNCTDNGRMLEFADNSNKIGENIFLGLKNTVKETVTELDSFTTPTDPMGTSDCTVRANCTVRAYTGMGMLPIELEEKLIQATVGSSLEFSFLSHMDGPFPSHVCPSPSGTPALAPPIAPSEVGMRDKMVVKSKREREERVFAFKIVLLERSKCDDQPVNKKARPNFFYPSLAVQVSRYD